MTEEDPINTTDRTDLLTRFSQITDASESIAQFFLAENEWDIENAIEAFFEQCTGTDEPTSPHEFYAFTATSAAESLECTSKSHTVPSPKCNSSSQPEVMQTTSSLTSAHVPSYSKMKHSHPRVDATENAQISGSDSIRVMSWNIDGLDPKNRSSRTRHAALVILAERVDVCFLQEVTEETAAILEEYIGCCYLPLFATHDIGYFSAVLLARRTTKLIDQKVEWFPNSRMGRGLFYVTIEVKNTTVQLMTTHLESTKEHKAERIRQLSLCMKRIAEASSEHVVIFGGDLNVRDPELTAAGGMPQGVQDMWISGGQRPDAQWTWDTHRNDNLGVPFKSKCRFDRLYLRNPTSKDTTLARLRVVYFELCGIERIPDCRRFPSDHWAVLAHLPPLTDVACQNSGDGKTVAQTVDGKSFCSTPEVTRPRKRTFDDMNILE